MSDRLSESELAYHRHLMQEAERVPALQQQHQEIAAEINRILAAQDSYRGFLMAAHDLQAGDRVEQDGRIIRRTTINTLVPSEPVPPPPEPEHPAEVWRREHPEHAVEDRAPANGRRAKARQG